MNRIAGMMMQIFEGALPDLSAKVSEQFSLPQRDVLHLLREEFRKVRDSATTKEKQLAKEAEDAATPANQIGAS